MSQKRRLKRQAQRETSGMQQVLAGHLSEFYEFLETTPQPSNEEVRANLLEHKEEWFKYCDKNKLTDEQKDLFILNVEIFWKRNAAKTEQSISQS